MIIYCTWLYRIFLESESDRDFVASLQELRLHFSGFITNLIDSYPRGSLFVAGINKNCVDRREEVTTVCSKHEILSFLPLCHLVWVFW